MSHIGFRIGHDPAAAKHLVLATRPLVFNVTRSKYVALEQVPRKAVRPSKPLLAEKGFAVNSIIYFIGLIVIVLAILSFLGLS